MPREPAVFSIGPLVEAIVTNNPRQALALRHLARTRMA